METATPMRPTNAPWRHAPKFTSLDSFSQGSIPALAKATAGRRMLPGVVEVCRGDARVELSRLTNPSATLSPNP